MILTIIKKELRQYFSSPIAYILVLFFCFITALWTFQFQSFFAQDSTSLRPFFNIMPLLFIILVPAVTMRTWAEESKTRSDELLLTLPYSEVQLVLGKFIGAMLLFGLMLVLTASIPITLLPFGSFEAGVLFSNYIGLFLIIAAEVSIGCFLSSVSKNQISNFLLTTLVLLLITLIGFLPALVGMPRALGAVLQYLSVMTHFDSFVKGLIDTRDVIFYAAVIVVFLFLNAQVLLRRKWR